MWSVKDMFYGEAEPVWIMKPEKDDSKKGESKGTANSQASIGNAKKQAETLPAVPFYPYYYYHPEYVAPSPPKNQQFNASGGKQHQQQQQQQETRVHLKIPICCWECVERVESSLYRIRGVKTVTGDILKEKVTVIAGTTVAPADILMECRKVFKKSRMWSVDD